MIFTETKLKGAFVVELEKHEDERGFFARSYCAHEFAEHGLITDISQCNIAYTKRRGTIRGLHYQINPYEEVKFTRCMSGRVLDVIVDIRQGSPTFGQYASVELTAENFKALYVPENFAHGYISLTDNVVFVYQVSRPYSPGSERCIRWDDPEINIHWPEMERYIISEKDRNSPCMREIFKEGKKD